MPSDIGTYSGYLIILRKLFFTYNKDLVNSLKPLLVGLFMRFFVLLAKMSIKQDLHLHISHSAVCCFRYYLYHGEKMY